MADEDYKRLCSVAECCGTHKAQGYCQKHYRQVQRGGLNEYHPQPCAHCGEPYTPEQRGTMYCGKRCKHAAWVKADPDRYKALPSYQPKVCAVHAGYCTVCGGAYVGRRERLYCGPACEPRDCYVSKAPATKECKTCGGSFPTAYTGGKMVDFCSAQCRDVPVRRMKRAHRLKRKAKQRAVTVETVDPIKVFDRDGWRCQLCGVKTPKAKRGTYEPTAPELDHIVPLSKSGEHSYRNTQCACRQCNAAKGDTVRGQMLLIG